MTHLVIHKVLLSSLLCSLHAHTTYKNGWQETMTTSANNFHQVLLNVTLTLRLIPSALCCHGNKQVKYYKRNVKHYQLAGKPGDNMLCHTSMHCTINAYYCRIGRVTHTKIISILSISSSWVNTLAIITYIQMPKWWHCIRT